MIQRYLRSSPPLVFFALVTGACSQSSSSESPSPTPCGTTVDAGNATLATLAEGRGIRFGDFTFVLGGDDAYARALASFDMISLPVFWNFLEPSPHQFDFSLPDAVADGAPPGTVFYVPGIITNEVVKLGPSWLTQGGFTGDSLRALLVEYVTTVVNHYESKYPGRVIAYEVVNEPLSYVGSKGLWNQIGLDANLDDYEYMRVAFATARAAAPQAKLYVDDFGAEDMGDKSNAMLSLVSSLHAQGTPIDGVGLECHYSVRGDLFPTVPKGEDIVSNMNRLGALGLETMITSADISIQDGDVSPATLETQAAGFQTLVHACLSSSACKAFSTWGIGDKDSWIPGSHPGWGAPLLFDEGYAPKPAYFAVQTELVSDCAP